MFKLYRKRPKKVLAVKLTAENIDEVAKHVGGKVNSTQRHGLRLALPVKIIGEEKMFIEKVFVGDYILSYRLDGETAYYAETADNFENNHYEAKR